MSEYSKYFMTKILSLLADEIYIFYWIEKEVFEDDMEMEISDETWREFVAFSRGKEIDDNRYIQEIMEDWDIFQEWKKDNKKGE